METHANVRPCKSHSWGPSLYGAKAVAEKSPYKLGLQIRPISRTRTSWGRSHVGSRLSAEGEPAGGATCQLTPRLSRRPRATGPGLQAPRGAWGLRVTNAAVEGPHRPWPRCRRFHARRLAGMRRFAPRVRGESAPGAPVRNEHPPRCRYIFPSAPTLGSPPPRLPRA
ncbi:hypothetical protein BDW60DRAFT_212807 [Aspergillus nidulans var. acristatus]